MKSRKSRFCGANLYEFGGWDVAGDRTRDWEKVAFRSLRRDVQQPSADGAEQPTLVNFVAKPGLRPAVTLAGICSAIPVAMLGVILPVLVEIAPGSFMLDRPVIQVLRDAVLTIPLFMLPLFTIFYLFEHSRAWTLTATGIEMRRGKRLKRMIRWEDIRAVDVAKYGVRLRAMHRPFVQHLTFIDGASILPHVPENKRGIVGGL